MKISTFQPPSPYFPASDRQAAKHQIGLISLTMLLNAIVALTQIDL